ncbi:hypothetical protein [Streptomyces macrosporus]|uniref:Secreted protein n=1 Tax=Streptomyces macrosporus TaxID=44032 RepID=A0ABN3KDR3_9ACTN
MSTLVAVVGAVSAVVAAVVAGWFSVRGSRAAARISSAPAAKEVDLSVLQASIDRLEKELSDVRQKLARLGGIVWSVLRWAFRLRDQVTALGGTPEPAPPDVEEFYRTGV